jgi:hypothetical protein
VLDPGPWRRAEKQGDALALGLPEVGNWSLGPGGGAREKRVGLALVSKKELPL